MQFYKLYEQSDDAEVRRLIQEAPHGQLVTVSEDGRPRIGLFNHVSDGDDIILHLNRRDEQLRDLRAKPRALVTFQDFLTIIPSHWVDAEDASNATMYYRYAEFDCRAEILDMDEAMLACFRRLMGRHQPDGGYAPLDPSREMYREAFDMLAIVILKPESRRTKWKLGQNRAPELRRKIIANLRERAQGHDLRAASELLRTFRSGPASPDQ